MASTWRLALLMALVSGALPAGASAMTVSPTHLEMVSIGSAARGRITVTNTDDHPLAVEAIMHRAILDERGVPKTSVAEDDFLIMPPQAIIPPGGTQNFRVQWLGEPLIDASRPAGRIADVARHRRRHRQRRARKSAPRPDGGERLANSCAVPAGLPRAFEWLMVSVGSTRRAWREDRNWTGTAGPSTTVHFTCRAAGLRDKRACQH